MDTTKDPTKKLKILIALHIALWALIPCLRGSLPLDSIEAIAWGGIGTWGYDKNPILPGITARFFFEIFGETHFGIYLLSQICLAGGIIYTYAIAREFLDREKSALSAIILQCVLYYGISTTEFNDNVLSLLLWPMFSYYFIISIKRNSPYTWLMCGASAGLNALNKYSCIFLFASAFAYALFTPEGRKIWKYPWMYAGVMLSIAIFLPHFIWLWNYDFCTLEYLSDRSKEIENIGALRFLYSPLRFIAGLTINSLPALFAYFICGLRAKYQKSRIALSDLKLIFFLGILPPLLFSLYGMINGIKLLSAWGTPMCYFLGIILFAFFPYELSKKRSMMIAVSGYVVFAIITLAMILTILFTDSLRYNMNASDYAGKLDAIWRESVGNDKPLKYVGGTAWWAGHMSVYSHYKPKFTLLLHKKKNPFFDINDIKKNGILLVNWGPEGKNVENELFTNINYETIEIETKNLFGKKRKFKVPYSIIPPSD